MKHIKTFESFLNESEKAWKVAYAGKGFYGVTNGGKIEGEMSKEEAEKEAEKRNSANESLLEADMTKFYDGFIVHNGKTDDTYKFRYKKGVKNSDVEEEAINKLMNLTKLSRGYFGVRGFLKKGTWDQDKTQELPK